ncbi:MAG: alpha/beta hydrolase [Pelistega sp.]|nr:alpha/beta hydrolase [Pelistega sp.]
MSEPRLHYITCANPYGLHRMAYWEWGDSDNDNVLLCVHGLTRSGRDFDEVAREMSKTHRVICPDVVGRGASDFHDNPNFYAVPYYVSDMLTLIAHLQPKSLDYIGTSMGGIIGMVLAGSNALLKQKALKNTALPHETGIPLRKMILNDVGPRLEQEALVRISQYVDQPVRFSSLEEAVQVLKVKAASFGPMADKHWETFARAGLKQEGSDWVQHYDLGIAKGFADLSTPEAVEKSEKVLWGLYKVIDIPMLIIHGAVSDLLSADGVDRMLAENVLASMVRIPETGHAPALLEADQVAMVRDFFLG